ncbi:intraflagellar transport protein 27 homolog isoform X3 [Microcaecilia unicolor]|uniref:Intraflagellar transport protein 27 homolog isoform X3 n=1 Tax=Microcaecilia unicolor TaxID=1415580 RepID=A0A6P7YLN8_9AMPH|nr:intraflagellar transport protein 27 homolog isoform X3 [Microcaecilia unicolor]
MVKLTAKCILAGDATVGKSTLAQLFRSDGAHFQKNYAMPSPPEGIHVHNAVLPAKDSWCGYYNEDSAYSRNKRQRGVLVGNKTDLVGRRTVEQKQAQEWAAQNELEYFETSAKEMENFEVPFRTLAKSFHRLYQERVEAIQSFV